MADRAEGPTPHFAPERQNEEVSFSTLGGAVQQPGTEWPAEGAAADPGIHKSPPQKAINAKALAATKYAVLNHVIDNAKSYQLLPQDMQRKIAYIKVLVGAANGIVIGPLTVVDNGGGYPIVNGDPEKVITAGSPVYAKGTSATPVAVAVWVEMFDGTVAVN